VDYRAARLSGSKLVTTAIAAITVIAAVEVAVPAVMLIGLLAFAER
jgi:hypothetical protein